VVDKNRIIVYNDLFSCLEDYYIMNKIKNQKSKNNKTRNNKTRNNKTRKYRDIKKKTNNFKKGGFIINGDPKDVFERFIKFSNFKLLSSTSLFGIILQANISNEDYSNYFGYSYNNFGTKIHSILIKLVALKDKNQTDEIEYWECPGTEVKEKDYIGNFKKEAKIQDYIFKKTLDYLEPICPAIVHYDILNKGSSLEFLNKIKKSNSDNNLKIILNAMLAQISNDSIKYLGLIAMEIADGYKPLIHYKDYPNFELYKLMAKLQLFKMFKTGFFHNDFHLGNILFNHSYQGMYNNTPGKALIIDFGFSEAIRNEIAIELIDNNKIQETFNYIYTKLSRPDLYKFTESPNYSWIYDQNVDDSDIINLLKKEEEIIVSKQQDPYKLNMYWNILNQSSYNFKNIIIPKDSKIVQPNNYNYNPFF
jgi:hypothetical protein